MDILITVLGNAIVQPEFRNQLFENPINAINQWGFHLTKGDEEMLIDIFADPDKRTLQDQLLTTETEIYDRISRGATRRAGWDSTGSRSTSRQAVVAPQRPPVCGKPCQLSVGPFPSITKVAA